MFDVAIIGGGIVGTAVAYKLSKYRLKICLAEKENDIALGATRANSAIIHAGYDPEPGTLMARLNVSGSAQAPELCKKLQVPYKQIGSMVLAFSAAEAEIVGMLYERGRKNGVPGLEILDGIVVRRREPHVSEKVVCALWAPSAGIINPWEYALAFAETAAKNGVEFLLEHEITGIERIEQGWKLFTPQRTIETKFVINAAGVHSDEIHNMAASPCFTILPSKGQYYLLDKSEGEKIGCVLFQCPAKSGKGVLVSPTVHGNLIVGPDAEQGTEKDRVNTTASGLAFVKKSASKSVRDINYRNTIRTFAGIRANSDRDDFIIQNAAPGFIDLAGIKSPGLSAAPAIADEAIALLKKEGLRLQEKEKFMAERTRIIFKELTTEEKQRIIREKPLYGRVICRCETITEGEIVQALHSPIPAHTVDGVKRRCNAGMGRCQGGFCGPKVLEIISREKKLDPLAVLKDKNDSRMLFAETKGEEYHV